MIHNIIHLITEVVVLLSIPFISADFEIKETGVVTLRRGDVGMIFYATVMNSCNTPYQVSINMVKCCENITNEPQDCNTIQLVGGNMGEVKPKETRKLSYIYPNMYPFNREGECKVAIKYSTNQSEPTELTTSIYFNTIRDETHAPSAVLKGYYPISLMPCDSNDKDPFDKCRPVDCHVKYSGKRSFYNVEEKKCEKVPVCNSDPGQELPDIVYVPISNQCRNLEDQLSQADIDYLTNPRNRTSEKSDGVDEKLPYFKNMRCHHGHLDYVTGFCVCNSGWTSAPIDPDQFDPTAALYHMCSIKMSRTDMLKSNRPPVLLLALIVSIMLMIVMYSFITIGLFNYEASQLGCKKHMFADGTPYKRFDYDKKPEGLSRDSQWLGTSVTSDYSRGSFSDEDKTSVLARAELSLPLLPSLSPQPPPAPSETETEIANSSLDPSKKIAKCELLLSDSNTNSTTIQILRTDILRNNETSYSRHWRNLYGVDPPDEIIAMDKFEGKKTTPESLNRYYYTHTNRLLIDDVSLYSESTDDGNRNDVPRQLNNRRRKSARSKSGVKEAIAKALENEQAAQSGCVNRQALEMKEAYEVTSSDGGLLSAISQKTS